MELAMLEKLQGVVQLTVLLLRVVMELAIPEKIVAVVLLTAEFVQLHLLLYVVGYAILASPALQDILQVVASV